MSRAATRKNCKSAWKLRFIDAKEAHSNPRCKVDVYIELLEEAGGKPGECGKLEFWLYGFRSTAQAWGEHYAEKLIGAGFVRG